MRTEEITAPGFIHDVMATTFVLFITSPAYAALGADLGAARAGVLPHRHADRRAAAGRQPCRARARTAPPTSPPSMRSPPATATGMRQRCRRHRAQCRPAVRPARRRPVVLSDAARLLAGEAWRRGPRGLAAFLGEALVPARGWLESTYRSETIRALWAPWVLHAGLGPGRCVFRPDRQGHRLRAGGRRRADRQGRREEPARGLRGADPGTRRRNPHRRRCRLDRPGRMAAPPACGWHRARRSRRRRASSARSRRRSFTAGCSATRSARPMSRRRRNIATAKAISRSTMRWTSRRHGAAKGWTRSRCCI